MKARINYRNKGSIEKLTKTILDMLNGLNTQKKPITIFCIGTDKCIGDALGPLVGTMLTEKEIQQIGVKVIGTLWDPVHAVNMEEKIKLLDNSSFVIAIDAAVSVDALDIIEVRDTGIIPGAALNKNLPRIGDMACCTILLNISEDDTPNSIIESLKAYSLANLYDTAKILTTSLFSAIEHFTNQQIDKEVAVGE